MGIELARAYVTVRADSSGVDGDLSSLKAKVMKSLQDISAGAAAFLGPVASMGRSILGTGMGLAQSFETARAEFGVFLGSAEQANATLERLSKFEVETPFEMPELIQATRGLTIAGERGEELFKTLRMLGDASLGNAQKFKTVALVYNQIRDRGTVTMDNFRQLTEAGVMSMRDLAAHFGEPVTNMAKKMEMGKIKFEDLRVAMQKMTGEGGRLAGMMKVQAGTMEGLQSTLNGAINNVKRFIGEPLVPHYVAIQKAVIGTAGVIQDFVKQGGEAVSFALVGATAFAKLGFAIFGTSLALRVLGVSWKSFILGFTVVGPLIAGLGAGLGYLASYYKVPELLAGGWEWLQQKIEDNKATIDNFMMALEVLKQTGITLWNALGEIMAPYFSDFNTFANEMIMGLEAMTLSFSKFVLDMAEWLQAIAINWKAIWTNLPLVAAVAWSTIGDIMQNAMVMMWNAVASGIGKVIGIISNFVNEIAILMTAVAVNLRGEQLNHEWVAWMRERAARDIETTKQALGLGQVPVGGIMQESNATLALKQDPRWQQMMEDITATKKRLEEKRPDLLKPTPKPGETPLDESIPQPVPSAMPSLKAGIFAFDEIGKKVQDSLLKQTNPQDKTNSLLEANNVIQNKLLTSSQKIEEKTGGGLADD